jgi:hypothetical protein
VAAAAAGPHRSGHGTALADQRDQRVTPVESRLRCTIIHDPVVSVMITAGCSLPWERWMVTA